MNDLFVELIDYENGLFEYLEEAIKENDFGKDNDELQNLYKELKEITKVLPPIEKLEKLKKSVTYFDQKYELLNDLSYYFDPVYIKIKRDIHNAYVHNLREENRKKRN